MTAGPARGGPVETVATTLPLHLGCDACALSKVTVTYFWGVECSTKVQNSKCTRCVYTAHARTSSWHVYKIQSHHMRRKKHQIRNWFAIVSILSGILDSITSLMSCTVTHARQPSRMRAECCYTYLAQISAHASVPEVNINVYKICTSIYHHEYLRPRDRCFVFTGAFSFYAG